MIDEKISKLGDSFRGLWQIRELYKPLPLSEISTAYREIKWYVTFKYNGDFLETDPKASMEEALDCAIQFLGLK